MKYGVTPAKSPVIAEYFKDTVNIANTILTMATETCDLEVIIEALKLEKAQLEERLNSELEDSEKEQVEARIGEICADLEIHKIGIP